ncbi:ExbD/TolR family protein [Vulgatibacter incomptus]|uniref:Adventurous gliding motility protein S n=1 Tax=Vulgatibacter incomptus TaxID=1391653 RepID=A0A0K1PHN6_9BACT|nr:biopolymer transporter ExbD [Vulgatibacter incomptus]AKU93053.1 Adventurous gliding motility protein S [Vulgatibacter incomptus]
MSRATEHVIIVKPGKRPGKRLSKSKVFGSKFSKGKRNTNLELNLTSMIDIFVLMVVFLIQQFSADGDLLFLTDKIRMPEAAHYEQLDRAPVIQVSQEDISVEGALIAQVSDVEREELWNIQPLEEKLRDQKKAFEVLRQAGASGEFKGDINIQADKGVPFKIIKKVMYSANQAGYFNINFAVLAGSAPAKAENSEG